MQFQNQLVQDCQRVKPVFTLHLRRGWLSHCLTECSSACSLSWVQLWFSFALFCPETLVDPGWLKKPIMKIRNSFICHYYRLSSENTFKYFGFFLLTKQYKMCSRRSSHEMSLSCLATTAVKGPTNNNQPTLVKNFFLAPAVAFEVWLLVTRVGCSG